MIGQEKLLSKLKSYTLQTLPKTVMLIGEDGCGKHTMAKEIANYYDLETVMLSKDTTVEQLTEYQYYPLPRMYVLSLDDLLEKQQNQFLKFIEEPGNNVYIFLLTTSEIGVLTTVMNRCLVYHFEEYPKEQLQQMCPEADKLAYIVCKTPGQMNLLDMTQLQPMAKTCKTLLVELPRLSVAQLLEYSLKVNYKEEYSKFDFRCFFRMFEYVALSDYTKTNNIMSYKIYRFTAEYLQRLLYKTISKENFAINYFIKLKEAIY